MGAIRDWRVSNHLTLMQAATMMHVTVSTFAGWESGKAGMRVSHLRYVSKKTSIPIQKLATEIKAKGEV